MGIYPTDFDNYTLAMLQAVRKGKDDVKVAKEKLLYELERFNAFLVLQPYLNKSQGLKQLIPLPWDDDEETSESMEAAAAASFKAIQAWRDEGMI